MRLKLRAAVAALVVTIYFVLAPFGYGLFYLWARLPSRNPVRRARALQRIMQRAFTLMHDTLRMLGLLDFDPRQVGGSPIPAGPSVLVGNHPTLCDVTALMAAFDNITTVVKAVIYRGPWFHALLRSAMQIRGPSTPLDSADVVDAGVDRLAKGFRVLVFPEGTRSPEGTLLPFGRTAFEIACRANVPVVPLVVACEPPWLTKEHGILAVRDPTPKMTLTALSPVYPADYGFSSRQLRNVVDALIRQRLGMDCRPPATPRHEADARSGKPTEAADRRVLDAGGCQPQ